jgi:NAD(P)-dependent dehydrogenase (short-subunit alcohol dehydrogenase family)
MKVEGQIVVVTGAAEGIGRALCERFARERARAVVAADLNETGAAAAAYGGLSFRCDVSREADIVRVVEETEGRLGPIGLWCSNAGVLEVDREPRNAASALDASWMRSWGVNVMAHVYAARALTPRYAERGGGWFLQTVSAAGLLNQPGTAPYAATKHAAIAFAESLVITHKDQGVRVAVLCPQGVQTAMLEGATHRSPAVLDGVLTPEQVAEAAVEGLAAERFLILPHPQVAEYFRHKAADYDRWLGGMAKLQRMMLAEGDPT